MKNNCKMNKGITLISLVVTIIVIVILAAVAINIAIGNNGLINRVKTAKDETNISATEEKLKMKIAEAQIANDGELSLEKIANFLLTGTGEDECVVTLEADKVTQNIEITDATEEIYVVYGDYEYKIDKNYKTTYIKNIQNEKNKYYLFNNIVETEIEVSKYMTAGVEMGVSGCFEIDSSVEKYLDYNSSKYVFNTSSAALGINNENLYSDGLLSDAYDKDGKKVIDIGKTNGEYYLHILAKNFNGKKIEIISKSSATVSSGIKNFGYLAQGQEIILPKGTYKFEVWGAQGGKVDRGTVGGKGGYASGEITIESLTSFFVYTGEAGKSNSNNVGAAASFNGGGKGGNGYLSFTGGASGGGATDIRLIASQNANSLASRIIVAGGRRRRWLLFNSRRNWRRSCRWKFKISKWCYCVWRFTNFRKCFWYWCIWKNKFGIL